MVSGPEVIKFSRIFRPHPVRDRRRRRKPETMLEIGRRIAIF
jgi:hypothetical protein